MKSYFNDVGWRKFATLLLWSSPLLAQTTKSLAASFIPLGDLSGGAFFSQAHAITPNGDAIVGDGIAYGPLSGAQQEAVRWRSPSFAIEELNGPVSDDGTSQVARAISSTADVVVGYASPTGVDTLSQYRPFRWTHDGGFAPLTLSQEVFGADAIAVSGAGDVIVGTASMGATSIAYQWTSPNGMQLLGTLPTDPLQPAYSVANGLSADGKTIVGVSSVGLSSEAFRWTGETGMVPLGNLSGTGLFSAAEGISADGQTIVGSSQSDFHSMRYEAFRWNSAEGMVGLGFLSPNHNYSSGTFTSNDGQLIFGYSEAGTDLRWFAWRQQTGMRNFTDVLKQEFSLSSELAGWSNIRPEDISDDSLTIVGSGINPSGQTEAWLVRLDHPIGVPEPTAAALLALAAAGVIQARRVGACPRGRGHGTRRATALG